MNLAFQDFGSIMPLLMLAGTAIIILILDLFLDETKKFINGLVALLGFVAALVALYIVRDYGVEAFGGFFIMDKLSIYFNLLFCLVGAITVLLSHNYLKVEGVDRGEYYVLLMMATVGMMLLAGAGNLIMVFLGLETMSIPVYVLAGFRKRRAESAEAALKYFLIGAFAAGFLLYGMALIYAATGSLDIAKIAVAVPTSKPLFMVGIGLIIVGLGFKVSAVPFHMWTPDVYQGAPTPITGYMSVGVKAAGFAVLIRLFYVAFSADLVVADWQAVLWVLSIVTMTVGNVVALTQTNLKRMLAYSSIAHAGYLLAALVPGTKEAYAGILFYLLAYALMNLGVFGCIVLTAWKGFEGDELKDYRGMGWEKPVMGIMLCIFMFSLAGIPPTGGFLGKFYVFSALIKAKFYWLAVLGILNSVVAVFYYLRVTVIMYMEPKEITVHPDDQSLFARGPLVAGALLACAVLILVIGLWPSYFYGAAMHSMDFVLPKF